MLQQSSVLFGHGNPKVQRRARKVPRASRRLHKLLSLALLEAGAMETDAMKECCDLRCRVDASDDMSIAHFQVKSALVPNMNS